MTGSAWRLWRIMSMSLPGLSSLLGCLFFFIERARLLRRYSHTAYKKSSDSLTKNLSKLIKAIRVFSKHGLPLENNETKRTEIGSAKHALKILNNSCRPQSIMRGEWGWEAGQGSLKKRLANISTLS
jgi:hypothetical protein